MNALSVIRPLNRVLGQVAPEWTARYARHLLMTPQRRAPRVEHLPQGARPLTFRFGLTGIGWGDPSAPRVLMLHGWQGRPTQFRHLVAPLLAAGRQVIALDAPAHGRAPGEEAHPLAFAEALLEVGAELRAIETVIGHSMGGSATLLALDAGLAAERAVVLGAPASMEGVLKRFAAAIALPAPAQRAFLALVDRHVGVPAASLEARRIGPRLTLPGLVVHDREDAMVPFAEGETLAATWPGARFLATQGLGHRGVLSDPGVVRCVIDFATATRHRAAA